MVSFATGRYNLIPAIDEVAERLISIIYCRTVNNLLTLSLAEGNKMNNFLQEHGIIICHVFCVVLNKTKEKLNILSGTNIERLLCVIMHHDIYIVCFLILINRIAAEMNCVMNISGTSNTTKINLLPQS